jgi:hypothetical protein
MPGQGRLGCRPHWRPGPLRLAPSRSELRPGPAWQRRASESRACGGMPACIDSESTWQVLHTARAGSESGGCPP